MSSMQAYLAAKYMSGPKADAILSRTTANTTKKKKRKQKAAESGEPSFIKDNDDDLRWGKPLEEDGDDAQAVVANDRSFKKRKMDPGSEGGGWISMNGDNSKNDDARNPDESIDDIPEEDLDPIPRAGLVLPSEFASAMPKQSKSKKGKEKATAQEQETVYRDATGRRVEVETAEQVAARKEQEAREEAMKQAERKEWQKGLVQREAAAARREEEAKLRTRDVARYADDKEINEQQKAVDRWNDPAAAFLTKKEKKGPKRPIYQGPPPPPNRFGIRPGYRWDGVDRSNGFEKKFFQTINEKGRTKLEAYQWSVDDM